MMRKRSEPYIHFTLPAAWINKDRAWNDHVRKALEDSLKECLGRCKWVHDQAFVCTSSEFGEFVTLLMSNTQGYTFDVRELRPRFTSYVKITDTVEQEFHSE